MTAKATTTPAVLAVGAAAGGVDGTGPQGARRCAGVGGNAGATRSAAGGVSRASASRASLVVT